MIYKLVNNNYVVSLTSFGPRFSTLHVCLKSLLNQSVRPKKILLWIAKHELSELPNKVMRLAGKGIEIRPCDDIRSYKKVIFTLKENPNHNIVTCDDDVIYPRDWLETLIDHHMEDSNMVVCHRARYINFDASGQVNPYWLWPNLKKTCSSNYVFPIGVGGVVYPANCFHSDVLDRRVFMELCPTGDDIWLKVMTLLQGVQCKKIHVYRKDFKHIKGSQEFALKNNNVFAQNDEQIAKVFEKYNVLERLSMV